KNARLPWEDRALFPEPPPPTASRNRLRSVPGRPLARTSEITKARQREPPGGRFLASCFTWLQERQITTYVSCRRQAYVRALAMSSRVPAGLAAGALGSFVVTSC